MIENPTRDIYYNTIRDNGKVNAREHTTKIVEFPIPENYPRNLVRKELIPLESSTTGQILKISYFFEVLIA